MSNITSGPDIKNCCLFRNGGRGVWSTGRNIHEVSPDYIFFLSPVSWFLNEIINEQISKKHFYWHNTEPILVNTEFTTSLFYNVLEENCRYNSKFDRSCVLFF